jgi:nicotinic acid mononucleotide adenylyltransferase
MPVKSSKAYFVGRFNPIHRGHQVVIDKMIAEYGLTNCYILVGSCNSPQSIRHFFSFQQRVEYIHMLYPTIKIAAIADQENDSSWLLSLRLLLDSCGNNVKSVDFFGGSYEDISFFEEAGYNCNYVDRYSDKASIKISASEVREALIRNKPMLGLLDDKISQKVSIDFRTNWESFSKK